MRRWEGDGGTLSTRMSNIQRAEKEATKGSRGMENEKGQTPWEIRN